MKDLNVCIESLGYHLIRAGKQLLSSDIIVLTINNDVTNNLYYDYRQMLLLESNKQIVTHTYNIMINGIQVSNFDMREKKKIIQHMKESNKDIERLQEIDIKQKEWRGVPKARQELASLVIEFSPLVYANIALDYNILLG